jgi:beta-glucanase (GH16 family)
MLPQNKSIIPLCCSFALAFTNGVQAQTTNNLLNLNFNDTTAAYSTYSSPLVTGVANPIRPVTTNSGLFPTAPTTGYLAITPNASAVRSNTFWNGWAANVKLGTVNSPYAAGGLGQTNLAKISLTARVRARGLPTNGAVVILKLHAAGDDPDSVPGGYKRVMFEPVLLTNNDWTTIGGTLNDAALTNTTAQGTRYNFTGFTNSANFQVLVELSGFNRFGTAGYTAYSNNPTIPASGGRKNPGFDLSASNVRVEVDDVRLFVVDPATNGLVAATTPAQLLRNPNFNGGAGYWTFFEGAYYNSSEAWGESNSFNFATIPGWAGLPYAGFMQNQIAVTNTNGNFFTLTFRGKFEQNYLAGQTLVTFMNGNDTKNFKTVDINDQVAANLGQWATYTVRYSASASDFTDMNGNMSVKIQPLDRVVGAQESSALIDDLVLSQQQPSAVGPQLTVKVGGVVRADNSTNNLFAPLIGYSTAYPIVLQNDGAQDLVISNVSLPGPPFAFSGFGSTVTLLPGESRTYTATVAPTSTGPLSGTLTVTSNDKETADQSYVVNLQAAAIPASDDFNSGATPAELGWIPFYNALTSFGTAATVTSSGGAMQIAVDSQTGSGTYPWYYGVKKTFASPGSLSTISSSLGASLRASGAFSGLTNNKVQVYLESLNSAGAATGRVSLGQWVDETTARSEPGSAAYFLPDGTNDRVALLLPEGSSYTTVQSALSSAISQGFNPDAPAFQLVVLMTDFDFDLDANNLVEIDSMNLNLATKLFEVTNGGFESDASNFGAGQSPTGWLQFPLEGVSKDLVTNGVAIYNASLGEADAGVTFSAYAGTKAMKAYAQNYYVGSVWQGPIQTGTVYQEWPVAGTAGLSAGQAIHARAAAKVYAIDSLTGGSTFKFGFRYMDAANVPVAADEVATITATNDVPDQWVALSASGTVPVGATKVQLISEFVQNNSTDTGAVYLDDISVGTGALPATQIVGGQTFQLAWSDEFDGSSLNTAHWTAETGGGGWGNNEVQTYTANSTNLRVENGSLVIRAVKNGSSWTSARIKTQDKRSFKYGKIEFRAKLPSGAGAWPAAWMMGTNIANVGWPNCGEIDVMEWRAGKNGATDEANTVGHALHSATRNGANSVAPPNRSSVTNPSTVFRTYAVVWNSTNMVFSIDGVDKATLTPPAADAPAFQKEFFLLLNLAMGGDYVGNFIDSSLTNATYEVDYVRVYQDPTANSVPSDTTSPVITLLGNASNNVAWGSSYADAGATAFDAGENASVAVTTNNPVDTTVPGSYTVTYTASDSKTNTATANRQVTVAMANGGANKGADGLSDLVRYAFGGTNTNALSSNLMPSSFMTATNGTNQLVLTYFARTNENVTVVPVVSSNLADPNVWGTNGITVSTLQTDVATNGMILHKRQAVTPATGAKKFLRLNATLAP